MKTRKKRKSHRQPKKSTELPVINDLKDLQHNELSGTPGNDRTMTYSDTDEDV